MHLHGYTAPGIMDAILGENAVHEDQSQKNTNSVCLGFISVADLRLPDRTILGSGNSPSARLKGQAKSPDCSSF
jgi:hypothetical protein